MECWNGLSLRMLYGELVQNHEDTDRIIGILNISKHDPKAVVFLGNLIVSQSIMFGSWKWVWLSGAKNMLFCLLFYVDCSPCK